MLTQQFSFLGLPRADHYTCTGVDFHARLQPPERLAPSSSCLTCRPLWLPQGGLFTVGPSLSRQTVFWSLAATWKVVYELPPCPGWERGW